MTPLINISRKQAFIFAAFLVLYEFLTYIANDMIMPGMIHVVQAFDADMTAVASALTAYVLGGASLQIFLGPISDRFGRRPVMLTGVILFLICTIIIALSASIEQFIAARFFQGMGLCFITVIGYATMQEIYSERDAVKLIALMSNVSILAPLLGPLAGSLFVHFFSWRIIFYVIAVISLIALWGLWRYMPESVGEQKKDGTVIRVEPLSISVIIRNYKHLFKSRFFILGSLAGGIITVPCLAWIGLSPLILMKESHLTVFTYALWQIPVFFATILGTWSLQYLSNRFTIRQCFYISSVIAVVSLLLMLLLPMLLSFYFLWMMPGLILYFFALGINGAAIQRLILFSVDVAKGTASALMSLIFMLVLAGGIEVANELYNHFGNPSFALFGVATALVYCILIFFAFRNAPSTDEMRD